MKAFISFFRRVRSVFLLCGTVTLLLYYTFQNELNTLNSYAETESLPQINKQLPLVPNLAVTDTANSPNAATPLPLAVSQDVDEQLLDPKVLVDKNRFFPLIHKQEDTLSIYSELELDGQSDTGPYKPRYPSRYATSFKRPLALNKPAQSLPQLQAPSFSPQSSSMAQNMAETVKEQFLVSWRAYSRLALGSDELKPLSKNPASNGLSRATTMLESLDMLYMLNQTEDIARVLTYISQMDFTKSTEALVDIPQSVERSLGALISAYELSNHEEKLLLTKATELGDFLLRAFDTPNRIPILQFPWNSKLNNRFPFKDSNIGQMGSLSLEFMRLTQLTKDDKYAEAVEHIYNTAFDSVGQFDIDYLFPSTIDATGCHLLPKERVESGEHAKGNVMKSIMDGKYVQCLQTGQFRPAPDMKTTFTAHQSLPFYNNMVKFYQFLPGVDTTDEQKFTKFLVNSFDRIRRLMIFSPALPNKERQKLAFVNSISTESYYDILKNEQIVKINPDYTMHHSSCALGSTFALLGKISDNQEFMDTAESITRGCAQVYKLLGVMPESVHAYKCSEPACDFDPAEIVDRKPKPSRQDSMIGVKINDYSTDKHAPPEKPSKVYYLAEEMIFDPIHESDYWFTGSELPEYFDGANPGFNLSSEVIESVFYLYRITGNECWRDLGVELWEHTMQVINEPRAKGVGQISSLSNVFTKERLDALPADWFSKHLKYYYLLFQDPSCYALDDYIFTHGGHLLMKPVTHHAQAAHKSGTSINALLEKLNLQTEGTGIGS
ncbi:LANO_0D10110g1_1 [Lachancea nothofagi CBS 11611]|uniref:alpha-1,2-Mannosidase n=1 Tax=Lachancea nothofagi CBS 11611 TaxID=1266666 RepID=A0A1G4JKM6_9SACH|nr:LANO_0D10110g1_1 [Lachancea nothofagi CBS 11611]